jgi:hypothetical protein
VHHLVADGWQEELLVLLDPLLHVVEHRLGCHLEIVLLFQNNFQKDIFFRFLDWSKSAGKTGFLYNVKRKKKNISSKHFRREICGSDGGRGIVKFYLDNPLF